jgi:hypothetical protein
LLLPLHLPFLFVIPEGDLLSLLLFSTNQQILGAPSMSQSYRDMGGNECTQPSSFQKGAGKGLLLSFGGSAGALAL